MSEDPLDPDDGEDDREWPAADPADDAGTADAADGTDTETDRDAESGAGSNADGDPFADVATDRAGDPFEGLGVPPDGPPGEPSTGSADGDREAEFPGGRSDGDRPGDDRPEDSSSTDDASAWQPLPEVSEGSEADGSDGGGVSAAGGAGVSGENAGPGLEGERDDPFAGPDPRGDPFEEEGVFERQEVGEIDPDEVWEALAATEQRSDEGRRYADVSKHTYCENCEWFSEPPEVSCTHEGTEIVEFPDMETVRLLNCPVVEERRAIRED